MRRNWHTPLPPCGPDGKSRSSRLLPLVQQWLKRSAQRMRAYNTAGPAEGGSAESSATTPTSDSARRTEWCRSPWRRHSTTRRRSRTRPRERRGPTKKLLSIQRRPTLANDPVYDSTARGGWAQSHGDSVTGSPVDEIELRRPSTETSPRRSRRARQKPDHRATGPPGHRATEHPAQRPYDQARPAKVRCGVTLERLRRVKWLKDQN